jgi:Tfp pilus assembly protein PilN
LDDHGLVLEPHATDEAAGHGGRGGWAGGASGPSGASGGSGGSGGFGGFDGFARVGATSHAERAHDVRGRKDVDLFDRALFERKREIPATAPLAALAVALVVAVGITAWQASARSALGTLVKQAEAHVAALTAADRNAGGDATRAQAVQAEIARLRARLDQLSAAPDAIAVSAVIEGLAAATLDGVWLTRIQFDRGSRVLQLEGRARDARLLPAYLQSLGRQPAFQGMPLAAVEAARPDGPAAAPGAPPAPVTFRIQSATAATVKGSDR